MQLGDLKSLTDNYFQFLTSFHRRMYMNILTHSNRSTLDFETFFKMSFRLSRMSVCQAVALLRQLFNKVKILLVMKTRRALVGDGIVLHVVVTPIT